MTSTTIPDTVSQALTSAGLSQYMGHARPVVDSLVARENGICRDLIDFATQNGMNATDARQALTNAGLHVPAPVIGSASSAAMQNAESDVAPQDVDLAATLARINDTLEDLAGFARQNGWRPTR